MESRLLEILVCPTCKGPLRYERAQQELICQGERLAFPIRDGVPVMLPDEARSLSDTASTGDAKSAGKTEQP
ncbi:Trm112 family protein [Allopusillimonas ginsengisoli]|uniref:Trm112 family protein n=1 Tax=Allopusillimonas ginsengisoli TaxID=453575 RepID=UPI0010C22E9B|nr:Trm112 family protein [Allopusillimonas ginsengisoli]